jgi:hypothetical protein
MKYSALTPALSRQTGEGELFLISRKNLRLDLPDAPMKNDGPPPAVPSPIGWERGRVRVLGLLALILSFAGAAHAKGVAAAPAKPARPQIEVCFVLDTTGSMGGLIEGAKQKIWSIANEMIAAKPTPEIKIGLVAYRDRGDEYVTRMFDLTNDVDLVYAKLREFRADGGGDGPESVNEALRDAVQKLSWSQNRGVLKIIFLVGDSPPHMDYADGPKYQQICQDAMKRDLIINTVQCGEQGDTAEIWREIAKLGEGSYAAIAQSGNMAAIATPMDDRLAELNHALNKTVIAYGETRVQREVSAKVALASAAPASVAADRLAFNAAAGVAIQGDGELLDGLKDGRVKLAELKKSELPAELQKLDDKELKTHVEAKQKERADLQVKIQKLAQERDNFITAERKRLAASGRGDSFDAKVAETVRAEAARKGISFAK